MRDWTYQQFTILCLGFVNFLLCNLPLSTTLMKSRWFRQNICFCFLNFALSFGIFYTKIIYSRSTDITQPSRHSSYHRPSVQILLNYSLWFMNKEWKIQDCKFKVLWCYEQRSPDQTFSVMNGCVRAWLSEILLAGSNMRHLSSRSFSCITLRLCSSFSFL